MNVFSSSVYLAYVSIVYLGTQSVRGCPSYNLTLEHLLEGNPNLRAIHEELIPKGILSPDGIRNIFVKLMSRSPCPLKFVESTGRLVGSHEDEPRAQNDGDLARSDTGQERDSADREHGHSDHEGDHENEHDRESGKGHGRGHNHENDHDHEHDHDHDHDHDHEREHEHEHSGKGNMEADLIDRGVEGPDPARFSEKMIDPGMSAAKDSNLSDLEQPFEKTTEDDHLLPHSSKETSRENEDLLKVKLCAAAEDLISKGRAGGSGSSPEEFFLSVCPAILDSLLSPSCREEDQDSKNFRFPAQKKSTEEMEHGYDHKGHNHHHRHAKGDINHMTKDSWIAAIVSLVLIGVVAFACIMVIPVLKRSRYYVLINHFLLALAVGSLAGDALIHLLPHAMTMQIQIMNLNGHLVHALYGFTSFLGILLFLLLERVHDLLGHKQQQQQQHSHGHSHDTSATVDADDLIKEIGIISAELNEPSTGQRFDKIGEKLSQHSKHSSFIFAEPTSPADPSRGCFDSCPPNLGSGMEDANGNNGNLDSMVVCKPRPVDHNSATVAECERLVNSQMLDKNDQISSSKMPLAPIPPPTLVQSSPPKSLVRQDSKNFNMVLQEYHVGHHGHSHHGHSHVTGKKDSLRTMILLGDGIHSFMDGMAIGAAFGTSLTGGIATAIAVLCHELPHKVGDFAILFEMGMKRRQAVKMILVLWLLSLMGLALGVSIGSIQEVSPWIYCFTAGVFLYLALVDLLSELSINDTEYCSAANQMVLQVAGMLTGAGIMLIIAIYEHDLEHLLEGAF